tara:strand:- start:278 stop:538 length:261 start_codon:yes stop_codon:yes gene_type:complete
MHLHPNPVKENMKVMKPISLTLVMSVFVGLLGMWIGGCETQEQKVERLIGELQDQDVRVRGNATEALKNIGTPEVLKAVKEYESRQ